MIFLCLICFGFGSLLIGCSSGNKDNTTEITLDTDESYVYSAVVNSLSSFKDPSSVTVVAVGHDLRLEGTFVKISAKNGFGGFTTEIYKIYALRLSGPAEYNYFKDDSSISVSKINQKLKKYKETMGWL